LISLSGLLVRIHGVYNGAIAIFFSVTRARFGDFGENQVRNPSQMSKKSTMFPLNLRIKTYISQAFY